MKYSSGYSVILIYSSREQGMALAVALVLLASMTLIGIATLSGTRLNEKMTSNAQQKTVVFQAAESAIESVSNYDELNTAVLKSLSGASSRKPPEPVTIDDAKARLKQGYDLVQDGKGIDLDGTLSVQYCGESMPIGTNLNASLDAGSLSAVLVDVNSVAEISGSHAKSDHLQRLSFEVPSVGVRGNCRIRY